MAEPAIPTVPGSNSLLHGSQEERRYCWVCFATEEDDTSASWVHPCSCRGSTKWVHQLCLQRWVEEKQKGNMTGRVSCPQCNTEYIIVFPEMGPFFFILDTVDNAVYKICPFVAAGIVVGAIYWTAVTYGAVTVMQVLGHRDGLTAMEHADPLALLIGLPAIPIVLILGKMVRWEDSVLTFLRKHTPKLPLLKYIMPSFMDNEEPTRNTSDTIPVSDSVSATGILCSALLFPTVATICGNVLFDTVPSNLQRTLLGGITFIALKGCLKIYYKQQLFVRQNKRMILDFVPPEVETSVPESNSSPLQQQPQQQSQQQPQPQQQQQQQQRLHPQQ